MISLAPASAAIAVLSAFAQASPAPLPPPRGTPIERAVDPRPNVRAGRVEEYAITGRTSRRERRLWVYTPPGYSPAAAAGYDLLVVFDGGEYLDEIPLPMILDALLADGKAPPFVAVLIDNGTSTARLDDLANRAGFAAFLADEVIPWVRQHWKVTRDPRRTIVTGSSAGGLAAAYVAFQRPDLFGNVLSQSGAFWRGNEASNEPPYEWLTGQIAASPRKDIRFLLEVGSRESRGALGGAAPSILEANRHLRDALTKKGYDVAYAEVPDGDHSPATWRQRLPAALAAAAGKSLVREVGRVDPGNDAQRVLVVELLQDLVGQLQAVHLPEGVALAVVVEVLVGGLEHAEVDVVLDGAQVSFPNITRSWYVRNQSRAKRGCRPSSASTAPISV